MSPAEQIKIEVEQMRRASDFRLDRIEQKIDQLSDAMISLARAEEKLIGIEKNNQALYDRLNRHSEKIDHMESKVEDCRNRIALYGRLSWILFAAITTTLVSKISGLI